MTFVYPQLVTGADLLRGVSKLNHIAPLLKERGATVAAIVNSKLYGIQSFYKVMKKHGVHPVIGLSIKVNFKENNSVLVYVYAKNDDGLRNLLKMSSAISVSESEELPLHWLRAYSSGCLLICPMTDCSRDGFREKETIRLLIEHSNEATFAIGISRPGGIYHNEEAIIERIAEESALQIAAVYESRFIHPSDLFTYEVAKAIRSGNKLSDVQETEVKDDNAYMPERSELEEWFSNRQIWLQNTASLLNACTVKLPEGNLLMPIFPTPNGEDSTTFLRERCITGLENRLGEIDEIYMDRMNYELSIIDEMGFSDYFLVVEDFMRFAKKNNILTGPGRGSSAGSLVAFALSITDVNPLKYSLIFERFLNPERISMPDIDIDFADNRRMEVIHYVAQKYGKAHVAQIITFGTLTARAVARNVARVLDFTNEEMAYLSSIIPNRPGITLEAAHEESKRLRDWIAMDPARDKWYNTARSLEGLPRNSSTHAAGVVLSPKPLVETVPLQTGGEGIYLTQWPMGEVEEQGLLKMDFLGLRNLTLLDRIRSMIYYDKSKFIQFEKIPLDDRKTFDLFKRGDTSGVFQFESDGMRETLKLIRPNRFEDLFAINALYRPGPMDNIPVYNQRKNSDEEIKYIHPSLKPILKETYGVIVYQEQIMQIAVKFAGYSMGEADLLRRAISTKNHDRINEERARFTERAVGNGMSKSEATSIYELIVKFADYGFPKSHAIAYSLISYRLAFLKANEPAYFYAALLSSMTGNNDKTMELIREAEARNIKFLPPSVKRSNYNFTVENGAIRIGLSSIKGVTLNFYNALKEVRTKGTNWRTIFEFADVLNDEFFTDKMITALIKAGALDDFGESRAVLLASIDAAKSHASFSVASPKYSPASEMSQTTLLEYEREVLGYYLSEHPAEAYKMKLTSENIKYKDLSIVATMRHRDSVVAVGLITEMKQIRTKKGEAMAFVKIQDETGAISCTFFPKQYDRFNVDLTEMAMIQVSGTVEHRRGTPQILVQEIEKLNEN